MTITELNIKIEESNIKITETKLKIEDLQKRIYKSNGLKITVGHDEFRNVSIGYINEKKREKTILFLLDYVKELESDIIYYKDEIRNKEIELESTIETKVFAGEFTEEQKEMIEFLFGK